jgi:hypothetical protein
MSLISPQDERRTEDILDGKKYSGIWDSAVFILIKFAPCKIKYSEKIRINFKDAC